MKTSGKKCFYNDVQIQDLNSTSCGYFSIYFAMQLLKGRKIEDIIVNDFDINDTKKNEQLLEQYLIKSGGNIITDIWNFMKGIRTKFNPEGRKILEQHGNKQIKSIAVCRKPVQSIIQHFMNFMSLGKFFDKKKELRYEDIFHLFVVIILEDGTKIELEKNHVPELSYKIAIDNNTQIKNVNISNKLTLQDFINGGINILKERFWSYNKADNNCQFFIDALLSGSGLNTVELRNFVMQKASELVKTLPGIPSKLIDKMIDLVTRADIIYKGSSI
jgi:hypothetical protein